MTRTEALEKAISAVADRERAYKAALERDAEAEYQFKIKQAQELLKAEGTEAVKKSIALVACASEYKEHLSATANKDFTKVALIDAQSAMSARQSLLTAESKSNFSYATSQSTI